MLNDITIDEYYNSHQDIPIIDVRSPGEFQKGHIPHAVNVPLFSDDERATVGTCYVQESREKAIELAYTYVNPKLNYFLEAGREVSGTGPVAVHCWRGGMRSHAFAEHLSVNSFNDVYLIKGGYKAFRNYVLNYFEQAFHLRIIGGFTGSGKTNVLQVLQQRGEQVIDLEALAHHKGSAFGSIGEKEQPTVEHFENCLFEAFRKLDVSKAIWIEDESINIGRAKLPMVLFKQIREQKVFFLEVPIEERINYLVNEYSQFGNELLAEGIDKIAKRLGGQHVKSAHNYLSEGNYFEVARTVLQYYDKAYSRGVSERDQKNVQYISVKNTEPEANADSLLKQINSNE
ncbi:MAG: tRNA 2-selenouridine(34) synthase MnmH [Bacteroidales bacterium]|nr:tRNA 2-selenouridine(34) synthase MnmH [Bacteroidales bacterium]MBN2819911.1 tRNA 2-selenouridine(34) synthase MnmH [Bacteroidales bacterium]